MRVTTRASGFIHICVMCESPFHSEDVKQDCMPEVLHVVREYGETLQGFSTAQEVSEPAKTDGCKFAYVFGHVHVYWHPYMIAYMPQSIPPSC